MAITISERRVGDVTVLEIKGRIVFYDGAAVLRAQINELLDQARLKILLDLSGVTYIDSFGVGVIATKYVSLKRKGGDLRAAQPLGAQPSRPHDQRPAPHPADVRLGRRRGQQFHHQEPFEGVIVTRRPQGDEAMDASDDFIAS